MPQLSTRRLPVFARQGIDFVWKRVKRHWWLDRTCILFLVVVVLVFGLSYYFMNVMANVASQRSKLIEDRLGIRFALPDVFFDFIGYIDMLWMTDMFDALMFVPTALLVLSHERPWRVVSRLLLAWGLASLIRITTVAITSVPDPRPTCQYALGNVFTKFTLHRCGDAIYSGHTLIFVICAMVWASFAPKNWGGRILTFFMFCLSIAGSLVVIANRAHYTIDVLLAWYIAPGSWYTVAWFWYWHVTKKGRLLKIEFPVEVGRHKDSDTQEMCEHRRVMLGLMPDGTPYDPVSLYLNVVRSEAELTPPLQCEAAPSTLMQTDPEKRDSADMLDERKTEECVVSVGNSSEPQAPADGAMAGADLGRAFDEDFGEGSRPPQK